MKLFCILDDEKRSEKEASEAVRDYLIKNNYRFEEYQIKNTVKARGRYVDEDSLVKRIKDFIKEKKLTKISTSRIQRKFIVGHIRTIRALDRPMKDKILAPYDKEKGHWPVIGNE